MTDKKIRIAVVGGGNVAQVAHLPAYKSHPDVELVALVEEDPVKRRNLLNQYPFESAYDDLTKMLKNEEVDGVDICTPNFLHAPMAIAALRAGCHVLCEKPIARNAAEARKMVDAARKAKRKLMVAMNNRFRRDVETLHKFIKHGSLGDVQSVTAGWRRRVQAWHERNWFTDPTKSGGGALLDLGTPKMDLAIWIAGLKKPTRVTCNVFGRSGRKGVEDSACAMVNFAGGSCLILEVTWNLQAPNDETYFEVYGTKGAANLQPLSIHKAMHGQLVNVTPAIDGPRNYYKDSYRREIHHFIECIQKKRSPLTTGAEALKVLEILDAMYESAATGREVSFA
jgi:predicted dehydrogenase